MAEQRERAEAQEAWRMLSSSARRDDDVLQTTQPGDALQLFADAARRARAVAGVRRLHHHAAPPPESRHDRRERLRDERRTLVAAVARRTGEAHRAIHARVNRATGARLGHRGQRGAARARQPAARAQTRLTSASMADDGLDALSSQELHDLAVKRARRHLDARFFYDMIKLLPVAEAAPASTRSPTTTSCG